MRWDVFSLLVLLVLAESAAGSDHPPGPGPGQTPAERCQQAIDQAAPVYRESRRVDGWRGRRASSKAPAFARFVEKACRGVVASEDLPQTGEVCDELIETGSEVPARGLALCLRATLEQHLQDAAATAHRPNVVLVLTDDQRADTLDFMPTVDRLAREGVRFRNAFVTTSLCTPSRASLYSGLYAHNHGSTINQQVFDDSNTLAPWLAAAGYATGFFGKYRNDTVRSTHVPPGWSEWQAFTDPPDETPGCPGGGGLRCYFGYTLNENGSFVAYGDREADYSTDVLADRARDFIRVNAERPFLAVLAPAAPHVPATPAARHRGTLADLAPWRPASFGRALSPGTPGWLRGFLAFGEAFVSALDAGRIAELETLSAVDDAVASLLDELERLGIADQTLFVFTSDHGTHWGEHGWVSKLTAYEESIRVPLVVRYPVRAPLPQQRDEMVLNIDIAPSIADAAGAATARVDGESFLPLIDGDVDGDGDGLGRAVFLVENPAGLVERANVAIRTRQWKYIRTLPSIGPAFEEIYDLEADPQELDNLARDPAIASTRDALRQVLGGLLPQ